jgi:hypothetical protein
MKKGRGIGLKLIISYNWGVLGVLQKTGDVRCEM